MDIKTYSNNHQSTEMSPYNSGGTEGYASDGHSLSPTSTVESEYEPNPVKRFINSFKPYDYSKIDFLFNQNDDLESGSGSSIGPGDSDS